MRPRWRRLAIALLVSATAPGLSSARSDAATATADELVQALQRRYDSIRDFSADFVHRYQGGVIRKSISERGRVLIKKPGKMRWEYSAPEKKLFVSDGVRLYSYIPGDKQVVVSAQPTDAHATSPALFLAGKGNLTRDFTSSLADPPPGSPQDSRSVKLVPRTPQPDYDWLVITVDSSLAIRGLLTMDAQGGESAFFFTNLKENNGLADKAFAFDIPRGVDVVSDGSR